MKKFFLWLLMVLGLIALLVFGTVGWLYYSTDATAIPAISVTLGSSPLTLNGYKWNAPVLGDGLFKSSSAPRSLAGDIITETASANVPLSVPSGYAARVIIKSGNEVIFDGTDAEYAGFRLPANGEYIYAVTLQKPAAEREGNGEFYFDARLNLAVEPTITLSADSILQGGVISVAVSNIMDETVPEIQTELGMATFTNIGGVQMAFVPVSYNREPGEYTIEVRCGDIIKAYPVKIIHNDFSVQNMTIDQGIADSTANSAAANAEYRAKIWPLYETADAQTYWKGMFKQPVFGEITTEYGLRRYINGSKNPERHGGIDIAAGEGTMVLAPNNGKVVFAEFIALTGNTVVIEHGAGIKSYFFHMSKLHVNKGDMIKTGDNVGEVGTTGFSTGAHLHYEVKIGNQSINPWQLFNGTSGIYFTPN
ncbi:MAG: M23 family metallopeptidase [Oscillospiraceae bacterium]